MEIQEVLEFGKAFQGGEVREGVNLFRRVDFRSAKNPYPLLFAQLADHGGLPGGVVVRDPDEGEAFLQCHADDVRGTHVEISAR